MIQEQIDSAEHIAYEDTFPLREFSQNPTHFLRLIGTSHSHVTLTVDGNPGAVLLTPAEYQRLLDLAAYADPEEGIRQGTEDMMAGRTRPAEEVFAEILGKYALPR
jgi:PHD/YefM family antitoxin component YafN of YafNO toxin-antitoxin module